MLLVEDILGNAGDPGWATRVAASAVDTLELDHWEAQKSRFRKRTRGGTEVAVSLHRGTFIRDGDILVWDAEGPALILASIRMREVMVIDLDELAQADPSVAMRTCVELGHALGNQHWPALVKGNRIYVPLAVDRKVMESVMRTHRFEGIRYEFMPGAEVVPYLAPHESRRLFGAAEGTVHSHAHGHEHGHGHSHTHG
jgi:urease accessory protein